MSEQTSGREPFSLTCQMGIYCDCDPNGGPLVIPALNQPVKCPDCKARWVISEIHHSVDPITMIATTDYTASKIGVAPAPSKIELVKGSVHEHLRRTADESAGRPEAADLPRLQTEHP